MLDLIPHSWDILYMSICWGQKLISTTEQAIIWMG
uniref:Uncharacterized protein n=1 Tax=Moniliophthora roreri TaxID=221103 RepID=A0A0W0GEP7_MONRR